MKSCEFHNLRVLQVTLAPQRLGLSAGFWSVWMYPQKGWQPLTKRRALIRQIVLRSFRELLLPRDRECKQTRLSVRWINRSLLFRFFSTRHLMAVRIALISNTLMCSLLPRHFQPVTTFQRHNLPGTEALSRWNLTWS